MQNGTSIKFSIKTAQILTQRELEILAQIAFGFSSKEIAVRMYLSPHTVNNHRKNMLLRSQCGNVAELVRIAMLEQLL